MLILWIICGFLFSPNIFVTTVNGEDQEIWVERGRTVDLKCPIKTESCGELHAVEWFKNDDRVAVVSGTGDKKRIETAFEERFLVDYKSDKKQSYLTLKFAEIKDEDVYKCDRTYLTPSEKCEIAAYTFKLKVYVEPEQTQVTDEGGKVLTNDTRLGPFQEGDGLRLICEARGARPAPKVNWYRNNQLIQTRIVNVENLGLHTVKSELPLRMSREDIAVGAECRIETPRGKPPKIYNLRFDVQVRPTKISLSSLKKDKKFVEGETAVFKCEVSGARPGANITWYNDSAPFLPNQAYPKIDTKMIETVNGTFTTTSFLTFNATMYDNGTPMRCLADNKLMRDKGEKPMRDKYDIDVLYPPVINSTPNVYILVNESNEAVLKCNFLSNPASLTKVRWLKDGHEMNLNQSRFEGGNKENPALNIKITKPGDSGSYVCELTNDIGTTTAKYPITVDVQFPPVVYLSMEPESPLIESAEANVTLNCSVISGNPPILTKVRWFLEGALLKELPECNVNQTDDNEDLCNIDPSKLLLQNVGRDFLGNYSCEGYNDVGWGPRSNELNLVVYYPPGNATLTHYPLIPKIKDKVIFKCIVNVHGLPEKHKYRFFRDGIPVKDSDSSEYVVEANIFNRAKFSCLAFNEGGDGNQGFDELEVHVPPTFVHALDQYTGIHYKGENASLTCKVQCYPRCNIMWFKDSEGISENDKRYNITEEYRPPNHSTGDFETVVSTLHFNMPAWPGGVLDKHKDNGHYSCASSDTSAGNGVRGTTFVSIEYAPFNVTVSPAEFEVDEGNLPPRISCNATAKPEPKFEWRFNDEVIFSGATLILNQAVQRTNNGQYNCYAHNKHGNSTASTKMNVLYKPTCDVVRQQKDEEDTLICTGSGNPSEISYSWTMKTENETIEIMTAKKVGQSSHLLLKEDFTSTREYYCIPNNTVGSGQFCKIEVAGHSPWYKRWDSQTILIVVGIVLGLLLAAIIICVIICCVCRRRRRQNKYHTDVSVSATQSVLSYKASPTSPAASSIPPTIEIPKSPPKWPLRPGVMLHVRDDTKQSLCANRTTVKFTSSAPEKMQTSTPNTSAISSKTSTARTNTSKRRCIVTADIEAAPTETQVAPQKKPPPTLPPKTKTNSSIEANSKNDNHIDDLAQDDDRPPPPLPKRRVPPPSRNLISRDNSLGHSSNRLLPRKRKKRSPNLSSDYEDDDGSFQVEDFTSDPGEQQGFPNRSRPGSGRSNLFDKILSEIFSTQHKAEQEELRAKANSTGGQFRSIFDVVNIFGRNRNHKRWNPFATEHRLKGIRCSGGVVTYKKTPNVERSTLVDNNSNTLESPGNVMKSESKPAAELHGKSSALGDPLTEPGEYENLPFHGLQTAPNKFTTTPINFNSTNVVRVASHPKLTSKPDQQQIQQKYPVQHQSHNNNPSLKQMHYQQQQQPPPQQQPPFTTTSSSTSSQKLLSSSSNNTVHTNSNGGESGGSGGGCNAANYAIPNKSAITNTTNYDLGNCFPTSYTAYYHYQQQQQCTTTNPPLTGGNTFINNFPYTVENNIVTSGNTLPFNNPFSASNFKKFNTNTPCSQGLHRKKSDSDKKFYSLKSLSNKKGLHFCSMKQSLAAAAAASSSKCKRHHSFAGGGNSPNNSAISKTLPLSGQNRNKLNFYEPPLYENLTDSIQIRESSGATPSGKLENPRKHSSATHSQSGHSQQIDDFNNLIEPEHSTIYRSDSGISNSSYDCATPVPSQRQQGGGPHSQQHHPQHHPQQSDKYSMNPVYMNVAGNTSSTSTTTTSSLVLPLNTNMPNNNTFDSKSSDGYVPMTSSKQQPKSNNDGLDKNYDRYHNTSSSSNNGGVNPSTSNSSSNNNPTSTIHKDKHHHRHHHHSKQSSSGNRKCKKRSQNSTATLASNECGRDTNPFLASTSSSLSNFSGNSQGSMETSTTSSSSTSNRISDSKPNPQTLVPKDLYAYNLPSSSSTVHSQQQQLKLQQQQQHQKLPIQPSSTIKTGTPSQIKNYNKSKCDSKYTTPMRTNYNSDTSLSNTNIRHQNLNSYSRPMKLPLRKHHSFHFQPPQTVPFKTKTNFKQNGGPLIYKPFTNNDVACFKPIPSNNSSSNNCNRLVSNCIDSNSSVLNTPPRICGTVLKRHMSNVESYDSSRYSNRTHSLSSPRLNTCVTDEEEEQEEEVEEEEEDDEIDEIIITQAEDNQSSSSNSTIVNQDIRLVYADLAPITNKNRSSRDHSRNMSSMTSNAKVMNCVDDFDDLTINSDGEQFRRNGTKLRQPPYYHGGLDGRRITNLGDDMATVVATPMKPKTQYASLKYNEVNI